MSSKEIEPAKEKSGPEVVCPSGFKIKKIT
jgi:hypothetical protein